MYCAVVLDAHSRRVVGWSIDSSPTSALVTNALGMAIDNRQPAGGGIIHSDQPVQFASWAFTQRAKDSGLIPSMGSIGDCFDNAMMESFWSRMQVELLDRQRWRTRLELANAIFEYLEIFYNRQRRHSQLGNPTPPNPGHTKVSGHTGVAQSGQTGEAQIPTIMTKRLDMTHTILMTGATGFLGSAILRELAFEPENRVHALLRRPNKTTLPANVHGRPGDLVSPESLTNACLGVDTVVHAASYVGRDPEQCDLVNRQGTEALVDAAVRTGVRRVFYVSTAAVYGNGPHRGSHEHDLVPAPASPISRSRLLAEDIIKKAGGVVLRPHLVYGTGDHWFLPTLVVLTRHLGGWIDHGNALLSTISVHDFGRVVAGLAMASSGALPASTVLHANHPRPTAVRTILNSATAAIGRSIPPQNITRAEALRRLRRHEGSERHLTMIAEDHWYRSDVVWKLANRTPGPPFERDIGDYAEWYRRALAPSWASTVRVSGDA